MPGTMIKRPMMKKGSKPKKCGKINAGLRAYLDKKKKMKKGKK